MSQINILNLKKQVKLGTALTHQNLKSKLLDKEIKTISFG